MYAVHNEFRAGKREEGTFESQGALFVLVVVLQVGMHTLWEFPAEPLHN